MPINRGLGHQYRHRPSRRLEAKPPMTFVGDAAGPHDPARQGNPLAAGSLGMPRLAAHDPTESLPATALRQHRTAPD